MRGCERVCICQCECKRVCTEMYVVSMCPCLYESTCEHLCVCDYVHVCVPVCFQTWARVHVCAGVRHPMTCTFSCPGKATCEHAHSPGLKVEGSVKL